MKPGSLVMNLTMTNSDNSLPQIDVLLWTIMKIKHNNCINISPFAFIILLQYLFLIYIRTPLKEAIMVKLLHFHAKLGLLQI